MGLFTGVSIFRTSVKIRPDNSQQRLRELEDQKLTAAAIEDYALALKIKEKIAVLQGKGDKIVPLDDPFKFPEEFEDEEAPEFLPEWVVKLPVPICWDETDDGIPPPCRGEAPVAWWKVFNPLNRYTNDNLVMIAFGNVGFKYFDHHRKIWMGLAMWSTFVSISFTIAGCFALSTVKQIVKNTNWVYISGEDKATGDVFLIHMGLRSLVYTDGPCDPLKCDDTSFPYSGSHPAWPNNFVQNGLDDCRLVLEGTAFGAFTTCVTLIFALIGTINRMRFSSDANIQKALGMITDLCGFISLSVTLVDVYASCAGGDLDSSYKSYNLEVSMGPGYYCYLVCLFGAMLRAVFHWVTPLPGRGSGCSPRIPASLLKRLDLYQDIDKDPKKVSWDELKKSYKKLVKIHHEERRERELSKSVIVDQPKDGSSPPPPSSRPNSKDDFPGTSKDTFGYIISAGNNNSSNSKASSNEKQIEASRGKPLTQRAPSLDDIPVASPAKPKPGMSSKSLNGSNPKLGLKI